MAELIFHFITAPDTDVAATSAELQKDLAALALPDGVYVEQEQPRLGPAEILTILQVVSQGIDVAKQIYGWVQDHRKQVNGVEVEIDGHRVPVDQLTDDQKGRLQAMLAGKPGGN
jgi:hypothetical protein